MSLLGMVSPLSSIDLTSAHPTIRESNLICKLFFQSVNPFLRILHQTHFVKELEQYRRGSLPMAQEFEVLLFSIYTLTINSLRPAVVESNFLTTKDDLLVRFQYATQVALAKIEFFKTDKIHVIQALAHYEVCLDSSQPPNIYRIDRH